MSRIDNIALPTQQAMSPLMLCDRLIRLAQDADQAGFPGAAEYLLHLADEVLDRPCVSLH